MGTREARAHERDGLRLGLHGRNRHRHLAHGATVSHCITISSVARCGRWFLEFGRTAGRRRNSSRRQHRLSMARISELRSDNSFVAYTLVASWAVLMFRYRPGEQIFLKQLYL